jgi:hypothetical protein
VVRLRFDVEKITLGSADDSMARHTSPNTYMCLSEWELGTATNSLTSAITSVQIFTTHGHVRMNRIMHPRTKS